QRGVETLAPARIAQGPDLCHSHTASLCTLYGVGARPGDAESDLPLSPALLEDGTPNNRIGAIGSAVAYTGDGDRYVVLPDRGPKDGATSFTSRFYTVELSLTEGRVVPRVVGGAVLLQSKDVPHTGHNADMERRFDPEAARVSATGTLYVADEYG